LLLPNARLLTVPTQHPPQTPECYRGSQFLSVIGTYPRPAYSTAVGAQSGVTSTSDLPEFIAFLYTFQCRKQAGAERLAFEDFVERSFDLTATIGIAIVFACLGGEFDQWW